MLLLYILVIYYALQDISCSMPEIKFLLRNCAIFNINRQKIMVVIPNLNFNSRVNI